MPCKYLEQDLALVVRCTYTDHRVCKQWIDNFSPSDETPYDFCEKQHSSFEPEYSSGEFDNDN